MDVTSSTGTYDPDRPWVTSADDDPMKANWLAHFFNPLGYTRKLVFLRGQTLLWILRLVGFIVAFIVGGQAGAVVGGAILFGVFAISALMSLCMHIRRLADAGKPTPLAWIAVVPMIVATSAGLFFMMGAEGKDEPPTGSSSTTVASDANGPAEISPPSDEEPVATPESDETQRPPALPEPMMRAFNIWMVLGFFAMLFSLRWLAGQPTARSDH